MTAGEAEYFVRGGVVVMKIVDAVAPLRRPAIPLELRFKESRRIASFDLDGVSVQQDR